MTMVPLREVVEELVDVVVPVAVKGMRMVVAFLLVVELGAK